MQNNFISKDFLTSFYSDVVSARAYILALKNIVETNNKTTLAQISFSALVEALIMTISRLYDNKSNIGCINKLISNNSKDFLKIDSLLIEKYNRLPNIKEIKTYRDKLIAHKDNNYLSYYEDLKECHILDKIEPFISFAEELFDYYDYGKKRQRFIENIKNNLSEE